jgi:hypothetical protein
MIIFSIPMQIFVSKIESVNNSKQFQNWIKNTQWLLNEIAVLHWNSYCKMIAYRQIQLRIHKCFQSFLILLVKFVLMLIFEIVWKSSTRRGSGYNTFIFKYNLWKKFTQVFLFETCWGFDVLINLQLAGFSGFRNGSFLKPFITCPLK